MQASIDERHDATRRLREIERPVLDGAISRGLLCSQIADAVGTHFGGYEFTWDELRDRLADLIDPTPWANAVEDNGRLLDRCRELERENARLKEGMGGVLRASAALHGEAAAIEEAYGDGPVPREAARALSKMFSAAAGLRGHALCTLYSDEADR